MTALCYCLASYCCFATGYIHHLMRREAKRERELALLKLAVMRDPELHGAVIDSAQEILFYESLGEGK